jgi:transposase InsO family protein
MRYRVVVLLRRKSDTFGAFRLFKALAENQLGRNIKALHDNKGGEYMSKEFNNFCDESGILRTHTTHNQPQKNGDAERANRTMLEHPMSQQCYHRPSCLSASGGDTLLDPKPPPS